MSTREKVGYLIVLAGFFLWGFHVGSIGSYVVIGIQGIGLGLSCPFGGRP